MSKYIIFIFFLMKVQANRKSKLYCRDVTDESEQ